MTQQAPAFRIHTLAENGEFRICNRSGSNVFTTGSDVFSTADRALADEALAFLNQPRSGMAKRQGSHRMKSMFGTL